MSEPRPRALARALLAMYPHAWRERYGEEMLALLADDPPGARGLASLGRGALAAHLRPHAALRAGAQARMRLSVGALFACWIGISLAGATFQKVTENIPFDTPFADASQGHQLLQAGRALILAGALLGAGAVAAGGLPLLWLAVRRAMQPGQWRLRALLALPPMSVAALAAVAAGLLALAPGRSEGFPAAWVLGASLPFALASAACALTCALVPRAVLSRLDPPQRALRRASLAGVALAAAMCAVAAGLALYPLALWQQAPALSAQETGPFGASIGATLAVNCACALAITALGLVAAGRAARAALVRTR
ncbi:MAG TPA: hypothetical protein VFW29_06465 [Solirubrobacteraceae bacterium]|nr:hypothetical protein [Solirubrobacteraceae bacterium]